MEPVLPSRPPRFNPHSSSPLPSLPPPCYSPQTKLFSSKIVESASHDSSINEPRESLRSQSGFNQAEVETSGSENGTWRLERLVVAVSRIEVCTGSDESMGRDDGSWTFTFAGHVYEGFRNDGWMD